MAETTQILLITVIIVLTILLTVMGVQVIYILKEFRKTVENVNKILDDVETASHSLAGSINGLTGLTAGLKTALSFFSFFKRKEEKNE